MMQHHGIKSRGKRKFVVTTDRKYNLPIAPNLLDRDFAPAAPNRVWSSDTTYIATDEGSVGQRRRYCRSKNSDPISNDCLAPLMDIDDETDLGADQRDSNSQALAVA